MPLPTGDLMRVTLGGSVPGDTWSFSWWYLFTGLGSTPSPTQMNSAANALLGGFETQVWLDAVNPLRALCSTGTTYANAQAHLYRSGALVAAGSATTTPSPGNGTSPMPNYVARCVTLVTNQPGRSRRGRFYLPGTSMPINATTGLFASISGVLGRIQVLASDSTGTQSSGYWFGGSEQADWVVVSSTHGYTTSITGLRADNKPDTQHGRENKLAATVTDTVSIP